MRLPDGPQSRALLIGASRFTDAELTDLPAVRNNVEHLKALLCSAHGAGIPPEHCTVLLDDEATLEAIGEYIERYANAASDLLLIYYAGHGLIDDDGEFYLSLPTTRPAQKRWTGLPYQWVRASIDKRRTVAQNRVVILDCCFSGHAIESMSDAGSAIVATTQISGTYTLTATARTRAAIAPPGARFTAFTEELVDVLSSGSPAAPELLTLESLYRHLFERLGARGLPRPQQHNTHFGSQLALARNHAFDEPQEKQHVNVGTIGHVDHGKSTLTAAISVVLQRKYPRWNSAVTLDELDDSPEELSRWITIPTSHIEYETRTRHYTHIDCPGHHDYVRNMVTGASQMDVAILVVSALDGPMPQTREHLTLVAALGVRAVVVALTKVDGTSDEYLVDLVESEVRDLLKRNGFWKNVAVVRVSALKALDGDLASVEHVEEVIEALDNAVLDLRRETAAPFLMPIEDAFRATSGGTVVTGRIERGEIALRHEVDLLGIRDTRTTTVVEGIHVFGKVLDRAGAGDVVGLRLPDVELADVQRGMVVAQPRSVRADTEIAVAVRVLTAADGGRTHPFFTNYEAQFHFATARVTGAVRLPDGVDMAVPGRDVTLTVTLQRPVVVLAGMPVVMREGGLTVAVGTVLS